MIQTKVVRICACLLAVSLSGCELASGILSSPEERINAAFPVSDAARIVKASALEMATDAQKKEIEAQINEHLMLRARNCAQGYLPSWHSSVEDIRRAIINKTCFADADDKISRWLRMRKVDLVLSQPPLAPIPETPPEFISADGFIQDTHFAENAGIALLATPQSIELVDIATSKLISSEARGGALVGMLSPNGRLYVTGDGKSIKIKSVETGSVIDEINSVLPYQLYWLDDHTAAYSQRGSKATLLDFASGNEIPIPSVTGLLWHAKKMPDIPQQYAFFFHHEVAVIELDRTEREATVKLLSETPANGIAWALNTSGSTADGKYHFAANNDLTLADLEQMKVETISFAPFYLQTGIATPDADKIIVTGFIQPPQSNDPSGIYLYSISEHTLTRVDQEKIFPPRYIYIPSLRKQGIIINNKISIRDELPTLDTTSLAEFVSNALAISSQRKQDAYDKQVAEQFIRSSGYAENRPVWPARPAEAVPSSLPPGNSNLLAGLARNAQIEGVGVYQGKTANRAFSGHPMGSVDVHIRSSTKPIVLVLSSYEPVNWRLTSAPGAKLAAVLVSGYYTSNVVGAGAARVIVVGSAFSYKQVGSDYNRLNSEVVQYTGKGMDIFQGQYEGGKFSVGGS